MNLLEEDNSLKASAVIKALQDLLTARNMPTELPEELLAKEGFEHLYSTVMEVRNAVIATANGDLTYPIRKKGYVPGAIKALQSSLHHLTWQAKAIATGDFTQRVDFMGEFSIAFNSMVKQLDESISKLTIAKAKLESSQIRITESLQCASVIQESILPDNDLFDSFFSDWFTLYRPCDIVGGDFYWLREFAGHNLLSVIDCTGHGVPGAFMTMAVNSILNHIVDTICSDDPARILQEMNRVIQQTLHLRKKGDSLVDAGLDIALCCIDPDRNTLTFAGAGLSLYVHSNGELREVKGNRQGVGYSGIDLSLTYKNHIMNIDAGTTFYATTDGFLDESGGSKGYGFGRERFRDMLLQHASQPLKNQCALFEIVCAEWRGDRKQRDDITLVGFQI